MIAGLLASMTSKQLFRAPLPFRRFDFPRPATWLPATGGAEGDRHPRAVATLPTPDNVGGRRARPPLPLGPSQALPLLVATKLGYRRQHRTLMLVSFETRMSTIIARVLIMAIGPRRKTNEAPTSGARNSCVRVVTSHHVGVRQI